MTADAEVVVIDDDSSGAAAPRDIPLEMLEKALENGCETLATLATNVMDFSFDSQHVLFSKVYVRPTSERQTSHKYFLLAIELNQCLTRLRNATYRNEFVRDLREIDRRGKNVNASIPMDVIDVIDKGRNPELCTYQMLYVNYLSILRPYHVSIGICSGITNMIIVGDNDKFTANRVRKQATLYGGSCPLCKSLRLNCKRACMTLAHRVPCSHLTMKMPVARQSTACTSIPL